MLLVKLQVVDQEGVVGLDEEAGLAALVRLGDAADSVQGEVQERVDVPAPARLDVDLAVNDARVPVVAGLRGESPKVGLLRHLPDGREVHGPASGLHTFS